MWRATVLRLSIGRQGLGEAKRTHIPLPKIHDIGRYILVRRSDVLDPPTFCYIFVKGTDMSGMVRA